MKFCKLRSRHNRQLCAAPKHSNELLRHAQGDWQPCSVIFDEAAGYLEKKIVDVIECFLQVVTTCDLQHLNKAVYLDLVRNFGSNFPPTPASGSD